MDIISGMLLFLAYILLFLLATLLLLVLKTYSRKFASDPSYPPAKGTIFYHLSYFNRLYDHQKVARTFPTFCLLGPDQCEHNTTNPLNVEHVLKTGFGHYAKGSYNRDIIFDLFGEGIFAADGENWKHQRKLASYEFSTRLLRDYCCCLFRNGAAKLVRVIWDLSSDGMEFDMQEMLMRCTLDPIFKLGFGVELNCLQGLSKEWDFYS